jgi:hypothetical protein
MKRKFSIWEIIIYAALFYVLAYALLKAFGFIKSPMLIEQSPYIAGAIGGIAIYRWLNDRFSKLEKDIVEIKTRCDERSKHLYKKR